MRAGPAGLLLWLAASPAALAGNGLYDIGFGPESTALGGADLASVTDTSALVVNPARLTEIEGRALDAFLQPSFYFDNRHGDVFGNDTGPDNPFTMVYGGGHARRLVGSPVTAGIGLFFQGGAGLVYEDLATAFGTRDTLSSLFGSVRLLPGLGWQVTERLSVGASLGLTFSQARQKFFPDTSVNTPQVSFAGFRLDGARGVSLGGKLGLQYQPDARWTLAAAYAPKTPIKLEDGRLQVNYDAFGLGRVTYGEAAVSGLHFASELSVGASYRPTPRWQLAAELAWLDWSSAMRSTTLSASAPDNTGAPATLEWVSPLEWRDQLVVAVGARLQWSADTQLRAGFNYGRNPVPAAHVNPTLALIAQSAVTAGLAHRLSPQWELNLALQYQPPERVTYTNEAAPFGPNASERWEAGAVLLGLSRRW